MNDVRAWFPNLEPAPGGERRLRLAMQPRPAMPALRWAPLFAACAVMAIALAASPALIEKARIDRALRSAWAVPDAPRVQHGHSRQVASGDPDVRLYLVTISPMPNRR